MDDKTLFVGIRSKKAFFLNRRRQLEFLMFNTKGFFYTILFRDMGVDQLKIIQVVENIN